MNSGKPAGPSEVTVEMIIIKEEINIGVMMKLCQHSIDGKGMPDEWKTSIVVPIFKMNCGMYCDELWGT